MEQQSLEQVCIFSLEQSLYAIRSNATKYVEPCPAITFVPGCPQAILGIVHLKGAIEAVVDLQSMLCDSTQSQSGKKTLILMEVDAIRAALAVDSVLDLALVEPAAYQEVPSNISDNLKKSAIALFNWKDKPVFLLSAENLANQIKGKQA
ncbi:MAG: hypothetical protein EOM15_01575 [Spirochaetia bacterium]|nr:hypothetical protein [Spirochaetia bacterium]